MAIILNIDTSTSACSVCLAEDGEVIAERNDLSESRHASQLTTFVSAMLDELHLRSGDISAIALSSGPGSYTGLRIGASVAKGLCYGLDKPLISVSTLQGLAYRMAEIHPDPDGLYIPMLDARRDNVYKAKYDGFNNIMEKDNFASVNADFANDLACYGVKNIYIGGPGAIKAKQICLNMEFGTVIENLICLASNINAISYKRYCEGMFEDVTYFEPFYLKEFEGRMKIK